MTEVSGEIACFFLFLHFSWILERPRLPFDSKESLRNSMKSEGSLRNLANS